MAPIVLLPKKQSDAEGDQVESTGLFKAVHYRRYLSGTMLPGSFKKRDRVIRSFALDEHAHREGFFIRLTVKLLRQAMENSIAGDPDGTSLTSFS
jgi:hypothetical protein